MEIKQDSLCFFSITSGWYQDYIPIYAYFINQAYPDAKIIVYSRDTLTPVVKEILPTLSNTRVVENALNEYPLAPNVTKILRFIYPFEELMGFKYVYIGDIDIIIIKESPPLLQQHIQHINDIGLSYSNIVRHTSDRITGLQFIDTNKYYGTFDKVFKKNLEDISMGKMGDTNAEEYMYKIIKDSGTPLPPLDGTKNAFRPHHGIHLGIFRIGQPNEALAAIKYYSQYLELRTPFYKSIICKLNCQIQNQIRAMEDLYDSSI